MTAKIFAPQKSAMQSGQGKAGAWQLIYVRRQARKQDPLMGWYGGRGTNQQVRLTFSSLDQAKTYATKAGLPYRIIDQDHNKPKSANYADNFSSSRKQAWTH